MPAFPYIPGMPFVKNTHDDGSTDHGTTVWLDTTQEGYGLAPMYCVRCDDYIGMSTTAHVFEFIARAQQHVERHSARRLA